MRDSLVHSSNLKDSKIDSEEDQDTLFRVENSMESLESRNVEEVLSSAREGLVFTEIASPLISFVANSHNTGVQIIDAPTDQIFQNLVVDKGSISFVELDSADSTKDHYLLAQPDRRDGSKISADIVVQTSHAAKNLQRRLMNTARRVSALEVEQGTQSLYLSLGMVKWIDTENIKHQAPLLLLPVGVSRESANEQFHVSYNGQEIDENLALRKRLQDEFGITIPGFRESGAISPKDYFQKVSEVFQAGSEKTKTFTVEDKEMHLGLLSLGHHLMYQDLDPEVWPEGQKPWEHNVVSSALENRFFDAGPTIPLDQNVDPHVSVANEFYVLDADSSQTRAGQEVNRGKTVYVECAPGTGTSQTITNFAAQAVAQGERVLILSKKSEPLHTIKSSLDSLGIGDIALEVFGGTKTHEDIVDELRETLGLGKPIEGPREGLVDRVEQAQSRLNSHCEMMGADVRQSGFSAYEVLGRLLELGKERGDRISMSAENMELWDQDKFDNAIAYAEILQDFYVSNGLPVHHPFYGTRLTEEGHQFPIKVERLLRESQQLATKVSSLVEQTVGELGLSTDVPLDVLRQSILTLSHIDDLHPANIHYFSQIDFSNPEWDDRETLDKALLNASEYCVGVAAQEGKIDLDELERVDLKKMIKKFEAAQSQGAISRFFDGDLSRKKSELERICVDRAVPSSFEEKVKLVEELQSLKDNKFNTLRDSSTFTYLLGSAWAGEGNGDMVRWYHTGRTIAYVQKFRELTKGHTDSVSLARLVKNPGRVHERSTAIEDLQTSLQEFLATRNELLFQLKFDAEQVELQFDSQSISKQEDRLGVWRFNRSELDSMLSYNSKVQKGIDQGFRAIHHQAEKWEQSGTRLVEALEFEWFSGLAKNLLDSNPLAAGFKGSEHERVLAQYSTSDRLVLGQNASEIALRHWQRIPRYNTGGNFGALMEEISKSNSEGNIRSLFSKSGPALQVVKPIMMMNPESVARYLEPGVIKFDKVFIEEGNEMPPVEALGSILRAEQTIIFGDSKRLAPNSPQSGDASIHLNSEDDSGLESLVDFARAVHIPERKLEWHYRSSRPALIAVSNQRLYDNSLKIFPASDLSSGLQLVDLPYAYFDAEKTQTNHAEASAVAESVIEHARLHPDKSLGVVTLSHEQAEAIAIELERLRRNHPDLEESFFQSRSDEHFYIKPLSDFHGDHRDYIVVSIGYGRSEDGKLTMDFGPLSREGGENSMNVLFNGSRERTKVFSSFEPDELRPSKAKNPRAVELLREYLAVADDQGQKVVTQSGPLDAFERVVKTALEKQGYEIHCNVGTPGAQVDFGIVHPEDPSRFILGLLTDGTQYQMMNSARDRERIHVEALEDRGWNVGRLWTLDWYKDSDAVLEKINSDIQRGLQQESEDTLSNASCEKSKAVLRSGSVALPTTGSQIAKSYRKVRIDLSPLKPDLELDPRKRNMAQWAQAVSLIVKNEGPMHVAEAKDRVLEGLRIGKADSQLSETFRLAVQYAEVKNQLEAHGDFLYPTDAEPLAPRNRSKLSGTVGAFDRIAPEELEATILQVVKYSAGIERSQIAQSALQILGCKTIPDSASEKIDAHVEALCASGGLKECDGQIHFGELA